MPIGVVWQDENGNTLEAFYGLPLTLGVVENAPASSVCLRFIDPFGDTTFNQQQVEVLARELSDWANRTPEPGLSQLLEFIEHRRVKCTLTSSSSATRTLC
jgi:hypothetical protein